MSSREDRDDEAVRLSCVTKRYVGPPAVDAIVGVDLVVSPRCHTVITGPSGSGKSTLVNIIGALDSVTSGRIWVDGHDLTSADERERAWFRRAKLGFVFQSPHLLADRSVVENVEISLVARDGRRRPAHRSEARRSLTSVGLDSRWQADPRHLSGGEAQRAAIARALVKEPSLIIMDEPTGNLDTGSSERILDLIRSVVSLGITVITVTHDPMVRAAGDRVVEMRDGRIAAGMALNARD